MKSIMISTPHPILLGYWMGGACRAYVGEEGRIQGTDGETWGKESLGDKGVDGRIILRWIFRKWDVGYGLIWAGSGLEQLEGTF